jgi:hypothetical protein
VSIIQRPVKQYGQRTYVADEAAAPLNPTPPPTNLKNIRAVEFDGDFDTIYALINGQLDDSNIAGGAGINGAKLADGTVTIAKLTSNEVDIAIANSVAISTVELPVGTLPALLTTGGRVRLEGGMVTLLLGAGISGETITLRWYEDNVLLPESEVVVDLDNGNASGVAIPLVLPTFIRTGASIASHTYKVTAQTSSGFVTVSTRATGSTGRLFATEVP